MGDYQQCGSIHGSWDYCEECDQMDADRKITKIFAEQITEASQTMEARMTALEADVKRLKRELGLK